MNAIRNLAAAVVVVIGLALAMSFIVYAQQRYEGRHVAGTNADMDFTKARYTRPIKMGATPPATCQQGEFFIVTSTGTVAICSATNTWTSLATVTSVSAKVGGYSNLITVGNIPKVSAVGTLTLGPMADDATTVSMSRNFQVGAANAFYFGADANDSWRIIRSGDNLVFQRKESGTWTSKSVVAP